MTLLVFIGAPLAALADDSGPGGNPVDRLTGKVWQESEAALKQAWLFGVDTAVAVEKAVEDKLKEQGKKKSASLSSPFVTRWIEAFGRGDTRKEIVEQVDTWYAGHPDQLDRPVMDVIWYEIVVPRTSSK